MHEIQDRATPIDYERYRTEAARLRSQAIGEAFRRLAAAGAVVVPIGAMTSCRRPAAASDPRPGPPRPCPARRAW
jgi:hypothetical protein